jgi:hypothetical protein
MALPKGNEVPDEAAVWVLRQLEHETERRLRGSRLSERHVRLHAADKSRPARSVVSLTLLQIESGLSALDFSAGALRLDTRL